MRTKIVNTIGLALGIVGVVFIFIWGPPQPQLEPGISIGLEDATPIDNSGKTVAEYNKEVQNRRRVHEVMSRLGLIFIMVGFGFQLWGTWLPEKSLNADAPDSHDSDTNNRDAT
jgi:hypothetical protein